MSLQNFKARIHNIALEARSLSRTVDSEAFEQAWDAATEAQRQELWGYAEKHKVDGWIRRVLANTNLAIKSFRDLRDIAKAIGVPYYNNKSKEELLEELRP